MWFAPVPPYTVSMQDALFASYAASPYLSVSSLGITPLGLNLKLVTITDPSTPDEGKLKVYVIAQQHSGETPGSFVAEGMIRFLLNESNASAASIRENMTFKIIPVMNVEGVYYGISRYTPFRGGVQYDLNRAWSDPLDSMLATCPEVRWVFDDVQSWQPDVFIDHHSEVNGESGSQTSEDCFFMHDGLYDEKMIRFLDNISTGSTGLKDYWPETGARSPTGATMAAVNVRTRLGVHPAVDMEHPHDDRRSTAQHPTDHNPQTTADWLDWGRRVVLGSYDYYLAEIAQKEYPVSLGSQWNLVSLPFNESVNRSTVMVSYGGSNHTWDEAVSAGVILGFIYRWNTTTQSYTLEDVFEPGYGYWMYAYSDCELIFTGHKNDDTHLMSLQQQWNLMGLHCDTTLAKTDLIVRYNGANYNWSQATTSNNPTGNPLVLGFVYGWNTSSQSYLLSDVFEPGFGYWMYAYHECTLQQ